MQLLKALTIFSFVTTGLAAAISGFDAHGNLELSPRAACVGPHGCQQKCRDKGWKNGICPDLVHCKCIND